MIQTAFLGDLLLTVPLLHWVKKNNPGHKLGLICRKGLGSALLKLKIVDFFWEIEKGNRSTYKEVQTQLKQFEISHLISPHTSFRTTLFCLGIRAARKITFAKLWNFFVFDTRLKWPKNYPEALRLLYLIKDLSPELNDNWNKLHEPEYYIQKNEKHELQPPPKWADPHEALLPRFVENLKTELRIRERFPYKGFVALFPGSVWATKMWKKEGYIKLGQRLRNQGENILIMGGPDEKKLGDEISSKISGSVNLCGHSSILESLLILSDVKSVVGNDSSSSHMAAFMGVPIVSFFGPTVLRFGYRPWGKYVRILEKDGLSCRPCGAHGPQKCPLGHHNCMNTLEVPDDFSFSIDKLNQVTR